ncbi:class I lanthipeptide [uncultured Kordia sp.]|uniref:class I lanthipeptide n=1 Tax=uncultured Kordia sp. TaxID=507699 RepID=UPI002629E3A2|nr:class I lanthipeptide [uncultured Kordia sp.]
MKKQLSKKLVLHKNTIHNLNTITGGNNDIIAVSKKVRCVSAGPVICQTELGFGHPCSFEICIYIF